VIRGREDNGSDGNKLNWFKQGHIILFIVPTIDFGLLQKVFTEINGRSKNCPNELLCCSILLCCQFLSKLNE